MFVLNRMNLLKKKIELTDMNNSIESMLYEYVD